MEVAQQSVRKMLVLVWSKETSIKEGAADAFRTIFLSPLDSDNSKAMLAVTAKRLCDLVQGANVGELASLDHIMAELAKVVSLMLSLAQSHSLNWYRQLPRVSRFDIYIDCAPAADGVHTCL